MDPTTAVAVAEAVAALIQEALNLYNQAKAGTITAAQVQAAIANATATVVATKVTVAAAEAARFPTP
jgi:hypothetical protein